MSGDGEGRLSRWSRLKRADREGRPAPDAPETPGGRGGAAPVAGRRLVASLPPLAGWDDDDPDGGPPIKRAYGLPPVPPAPADSAEEDETRELTPEEQEAVKDLPPIESLDKDSDFTPFLAENVPDFLRRQALRVLWRSDPVLANLDGLNDYDEDFRLATLLGKALTGAKGAKRAGKKVARKRAKGKKAAETAKAPETPDAEARESAAGDDGDGDADVGDADGDVD